MAKIDGNGPARFLFWINCRWLYLKVTTTNMTHCIANCTSKLLETYRVPRTASGRCRWGGGARSTTRRRWSPAADKPPPCRPGSSSWSWCTRTSSVQVHGSGTTICQFCGWFGWRSRGRSLVWQSADLGLSLAHSRFALIESEQILRWTLSPNEASINRNNN